MTYKSELGDFFMQIKLVSHSSIKKKMVMKIKFAAAVQSKGFLYLL
jgi:hypothetical protein